MRATAAVQKLTLRCVSLRIQAFKFWESLIFTTETCICYKRLRHFVEACYILPQPVTTIAIFGFHALFQLPNIVLMISHHHLRHPGRPATFGHHQPPLQLLEPFLCILRQAKRHHQPSLLAAPQPDATLRPFDDVDRCKRRFDTFATLTLLCNMRQLWACETGRLPGFVALARRRTVDYRVCERDEC